MQAQPEIPTGRIEAFSDGVIAILITIMVFDLKFTAPVNSGNVEIALGELLPKFISYAFSFLMLGIMWVNHHQLFHQIRHSERRLLWYNLFLLFWMSVVPFVTHFIGMNPLYWPASTAYGVVFSLCAFSFYLLRNFVVRQNLLHAHIEPGQHVFIRNKNLISVLIYLIAAVLAPISVYISFGLFAIVPALYFVPEKIVTKP